MLSDSPPISLDPLPTAGLPHEIHLIRGIPRLGPGGSKLLRLPLVPFHQVAKSGVLGRAAGRAAMLIVRVHAKQKLLIVWAELKYQLHVRVKWVAQSNAVAGRRVVRIGGEYMCFEKIASPGAEGPNQRP